MKQPRTWRDWSALLQVVLNAEAEVQGAYRIGGLRGAWVDGTARSDVRDEISRAARAVASEGVEKNQARADLTFKKLATPLILKAIEHSSNNGFKDETEIMHDLHRLEHRAAAVDGWRDLRRSIRLGLDAATAKAGVPNVPPASVSFRRAGPKVGRNDSCPCGSGKKHKRCCLV